MKRNDIVLIIIILCIGFVITAMLKINNTEGNKVVITIDKEVYKVFSLDEDMIFTIELENNEWNRFEIKDGKVKMLDASCPDKICVKHRKIHYNNEDIICIPNRVKLFIISDEESEIDAIVH